MPRRVDHKCRSFKPITVLLLSFLVGCATSKPNFYSDRTAASNAGICRAIREATTVGDSEYGSDLRKELGRRGVSFTSCDQILRDQAVAIGAGVLVAVAVVAAARNAGGGGGGYGGAYDYDWEWDAFYSSSYQMVWACRGVQTGQFADGFKCQAKQKTDWKWPEK